MLQAAFIEPFSRASGSALLLRISSLPRCRAWELAWCLSLSLSCRKPSSQSGASQNNALQSAALRSCLSGSLLHPLLWCECKHQGPSTHRMPWPWWRAALKGRSNRGFQTIGALGISSGKFGLPGPWLPAALNFPQASEELLWGFCCMSPVPPPPEVPAAPLLVWLST